ncbi:MAG: DUF4296 domain-containing protein [Ferruginibacter sp.]
MKLIYLLMCAVLLYACRTNPKDILSGENMENILWELTKADAFTQEFIVKDTSADLVKENLKLQQKIFAKNNTDRKTFYKSYDYYLHHEELLKPLLDSIVVKNGRIKENERLKKIIKVDDEQIK